MKNDSADVSNISPCSSEQSSDEGLALEMSAQSDDTVHCFTCYANPDQRQFLQGLAFHCNYLLVFYRSVK